MCNTNYQYFQSAPRKTGPLAECQGGRGCGCTRPCIGLCRGFLEATGLQCLPPETRWPLVSFVICFNWFFYKFQTTQKAKWKLGRSNYLNIQKFVRCTTQFAKGLWGVWQEQRSEQSKQHQWTPETRLACRLHSSSSSASCKLQKAHSWLDFKWAADLFTTYRMGRKQDFVRVCCAASEERWRPLGSEYSSRGNPHVWKQPLQVWQPEATP